VIPPELRVTRPEPALHPGPALHCDPRTSVLEFGPLPTAVPCARLHARNIFAEWRLPPGVAADAEVLVSELITNALRGTRSLRDPQPIALRLRVNAWWLLIEAWDHCPGDPAARPVPFDSESGRDLPEGGRGLAVIEAYSDHWGCLRVNEQMKAVWCELRLAPAVASDKAAAECVYEGEK
jgi:anti-sigma regulatory factor (Ser/Thr protein kinase)